VSTPADDLPRCWSMSDPLYVGYHDNEWGRPVTTEHGIYERLCLEGFQSGLSWLTILRKREAFRQGFAGFELERVAAFGEEDVERLLGDEGIVRHRGKIEAVIGNAGRALELIAAEGSLASYLWGFEPPALSQPLERSQLGDRELPAEAKALSRDLKRRGWRFVGPTTVYAFMQAMGLLNDHVEGCLIRAKVDRARRKG